MKKHMTRSLCCLLALLLCLGSAIYTPAAQDDQAQVSFTVTLATGKATDYATLKVQDKDGKTMPCQEDEYGYDTYDYLLPAGDYTYTATYQSGSQTASGSFTVTAGESRQIPVQLTYTQYKVRFNTTPQNATVALYKNGVSGDGLAMIEYSGVHSDPDFGHYADIDSDYQDVNVQSAIEAYLAKKVKSDYPITVTVDKVENDEWDEDYTVIDKNGKIHYNAVTDDMLNFDETGAELTVSVTLTCLQSTKESEVTVLVPMHTYSRQERLDAAAKKAADLQTLLGDNTAADRVTEPVNLPTGDDDFSYYGIVTGWTSDHPEVIDPTTGAVTPAKADTTVTLTVKAFYTAAQLEEAGFLFDPGPLGDNQSLQTVTLTVPGTGEPEPPTDPDGPTDPQPPTDPEGPTDPVQPTDPAAPTDPVVPTEPTTAKETTTKQTETTTKSAKAVKKSTAKSPSTGHTGAAAGALLCGAALLALTAAKRKHTEE